LPTVSLAVVKDGRIVKAAGYGLASLELDAPASEKTVYEIDSNAERFRSRGHDRVSQRNDRDMSDEFLGTTRRCAKDRAWRLVNGKARSNVADSVSAVGRHGDS
jgi:hypothetical protein